MNAHLRRRRTIVPFVTLLCAGIVGLFGLDTAGVNAEGVPTPSETSIAEVTVTTAPRQTVDAAVVVQPTAPTGTTMPIAP